MDVEQVRTILAPHRDRLTAMGVCSLSVFGSVARGEAGPESDIDLLVELDPSRHLSLLEVAHLLGELEDLLGRKVDLVEPHLLRPALRDRILKEAVRAA